MPLVTGSRPGLLEPIFSSSWAARLTEGLLPLTISGTADEDVPTACQAPLVRTAQPVADRVAGKHQHGDQRQLDPIHAPPFDEVRLGRLWISGPPAWLS